MPSIHNIPPPDPTIPPPKPLFQFDTKDPQCPHCSQRPMVEYAIGIDNDLLYWCGHCGILVEILFTGVTGDRIQVRTHNCLH